MDDKFRPLGEEKTHFWLTKGMARATGVDMVAALDEGRISRDDYANLFSRCRKCAFARDCDKWLDRQWDGPVSAPDACENRDVWDRLLKGQ